MKSRFLIMFLIASLLLAMFVCVGPTTVFAEAADEEQSESLGDTLAEDMGWADSEFLDGPFGKIIVGIFLVFAAIVNAIGAVFSTIIAFVAGIGTFLWGIVEFFVGLFQ
ncbi:MAG: hypothetical protein E7461_01575 [Ruminococcaceae bacterium]|nr:hypothetical protein [Oscillospiraceae bacterium]